MGAQQDVAEKLVPYEDDSWGDECAFAQYAAAAVVYPIRCRLTGKEQEAAWAARQVYEALDLWVTTRDDVVDVNTPGVDERSTADPLNQAELARQEARHRGAQRGGGRSHGIIGLEHQRNGPR